MKKLVTLTSLVRELSKQYSLADIETAILAKYCSTHNLVPVDNTKLFVTVHRDINVDINTELQKTDTWTMDEIVSSFEVLVPQAEAELYGAVFTPSPITSFMAKELVARAKAGDTDMQSLTVLDPTVGCGALLIAMIKTLYTETGQLPSDIASRLYGLDISANSVERAQLLIELTCLSLGDTNPPKPHLYVANALTEATELLKDVEINVVIANPPYVRFQYLPVELREGLVERWYSCGQGNFNLYFPFFELAHELLTDDGIAAFITPNGFLDSLSGKPLRSWMLSTDWLDEVIDFSHHKVFEALAYTAITFGTKRAVRTDGALGYIDLAGLVPLSNLSSNWAKESVRRVPLQELSAASWRLVGPTKYANIQKIMATGKPLSSYVDIRFGLQTGRDGLYLAPGTKDADGNYLTAPYKGSVYPVEPTIMRRCVKVSNVHSQPALDSHEGMALYPYTIENGQAVIIDEDVLARDFPLAYTYLLAIKPELDKRDNGKKVYATWYAYCRTQSIVPSGEKLLSPLYASSPRFMTEVNDSSVFMNGVGLTLLPGADLSLEVLSSLLNSSVCKFFVEATSNAIEGGFFAYQKQQLSRFMVPALNGDDVLTVLSLSTIADRNKFWESQYSVKL